MKTKNTQRRSQPNPQQQAIRALMGQTGCSEKTAWREVVDKPRFELRRARCLAAVAAMNGITPEQAAKRILDREMDLVWQDLELPTTL